MAVDQRDAPGELADFGRRLARPLVDDRRDTAEAVALSDRDMARQQHEHSGAGLAGFEQGFAIPETSRFAEPAHAFDFVRRQRRECLLEARKREGGRTRRSTGRRVVCTHLTTQKKLVADRSVTRRAFGNIPWGLSTRLVSACVI